LFIQEIKDEEETFEISSSSTLEEDHEARQESRHAMNMTTNGSRIEASAWKTSKTHMQEGANRENARSSPAKNGVELGQKGPGPTGLVGSAWPGSGSPLT
jgi:hypothetical protein